MVQGVISIDTPHRGAPAMGHGRTLALATFAAAGVGIAYECTSRRRLCWALEALPAGGTGAIYKMFHTSGLVYDQMIPGSGFLTSLNATPDPFIKVGIVGHSSKAWQWVRMYADAGNPPESPLGGRARVREMSRTYKHLWKSSFLRGLLGVVAVAAGQPALATSLFRRGVTDVAAGLALKAVDVVYRAVTSPGDEGDGIVPVNSQRYPYADKLYEIRGADSHLGATKSDLVRDQVRAALQERFFLIPKQ